VADLHLSWLGLAPNVLEHHLGSTMNGVAAAQALAQGSGRQAARIARRWELLTQQGQAMTADMGTAVVTRPLQAQIDLLQCANFAVGNISCA